jgi:hypothetical protein
MIYNDAYRDFAVERHPELLGKVVVDGWPEVAGFNRNVLAVCLAGGALHYKDQELALNRTGSMERVWLDLDYSPVVGDDGQPFGVLAQVFESTDRVIACGFQSGWAVECRPSI